ncbi:indolepyruvate ferredoxin oxidoreductase, beta subunit [Azospirillaceae bacterium]
MNETSFPSLNILVVGIGGQGVMTAAEVLAQVAIDHGYDAKKSEIAGMAQRGGVVTSHVRIGRLVHSPVISPGTADALLAFEIAEAVRWRDQVRADGKIVVNTQQLIPPVVSGGLFSYPENPLAILMSCKAEVYPIDAEAISHELQNRKLINTIMLGAISDHLPFPASAIEEKIVERFQIRKPQLADLNRKAFAAGRHHANTMAKR